MASDANALPKLKFGDRVQHADETYVMEGRVVGVVGPLVRVCWDVYPGCEDDDDPYYTVVRLYEVKKCRW